MPAKTQKAEPKEVKIAAPPLSAPPPSMGDGGGDRGTFIQQAAAMVPKVGGKAGGIPSRPLAYPGTRLPSTPARVPEPVVNVMADVSRFAFGESRVPGQVITPFERKLGITQPRPPTAAGPLGIVGIAREGWQRGKTDLSMRVRAGAETTAQKFGASPQLAQGIGQGLQRGLNVTYDVAAFRPPREGPVAGVLQSFLNPALVLTPLDELVRFRAIMYDPVLLEGLGNAVNQNFISEDIWYNIVSARLSRAGGATESAIAVTLNQQGLMSPEVAEMVVADDLAAGAITQDGADVMLSILRGETQAPIRPPSVDPQTYLFGHTPQRAARARQLAQASATQEETLYSGFGPGANRTMANAGLLMSGIAAVTPRDFSPQIASREAAIEAQRRNDLLRRQQTGVAPMVPPEHPRGPIYPVVYSLEEKNAAKG